MNNTESLKTSFKAAGAVYVEIIGNMVCTTWATKALADKCEQTMRRCGITDVERGMNGDESAYVCTGWIG